MSNSIIPGELLPGKGKIILNEGRKTQTLKVKNTGDRPVQVGSHFHFFEVNKVLDFPREKAFGMRLDIPAGTAVRFEPGDEKEVDLVEVAGKQYIYGLNNLTNGSIKQASVKQRALRLAKEQGFKGV
jgi:urease beta subunit